LRVQALWHYPVKSLLGEPHMHLSLDDRGIAGDRLFALIDPDGKIGSGKTTNRFKRIDRLLSLRAVTDEGPLQICFPDGQKTEISDGNLDSQLSGFLGQLVALRREREVPHHDDSALHLLLSSELAALQDHAPDARIDPRRFRANIILDTPGSMTADDLLGRTLTIAGTRLLVTHKTERCRMVTMEQSDLPFDPRILRTIAQAFDMHFGLYARILKPGPVSVGDPVEVSAARPAPQGRFSTDLGI